MIKFEAWPPPNWTEVIIYWDDILVDVKNNPRQFYEWCHEHPSTGRFHVHGWRATEGFSFRFEDPRDATLFALRWS